MIATNKSTRRIQRLIDFRCSQTEQLVRDRFQKDLQWNQEKARLSRVSTIQDDDLIEQMLSLGINAENMAALHKFPVAMSAWASGSVTSQEAQVAFQETYTCEISGRSSEVKLFISWLITKPPEKMWQIWENYVRMRIPVVGLRHTQTIGRSIYRLAEKVAMESGGFWGYATICREEQEVLERIQKCYLLK
ncbi:hypothetical protein F1728_24480 [Gimesia benthica]|uniref:Uncharacterized protein n=1 Tax=Gimesia benthica TaxID=2608982 RepID=A0A6I6AG96_9PLAN|nr:hypothetical protein [Gimesia benthica]QGQ25644.1 hypothetical protein F1728_24480 [Gimesia benthica]